MLEEKNFREKLEAVLTRLLSNNPNIRIATISSLEGLPIVSILPRGSNETMVSALVATLLSLSERAVMDLKIGEFSQLFIKGINGSLLVFEAEPAVLAVSTTKKAKLGLIFFECERTCREISQLFQNEK
ncbi:MAG: roadblock/LC7 domain-containing protein [Promethearchaeota archaeon]